MIDAVNGAQIWQGTEKFGRRTWGGGGRGWYIAQIYQIEIWVWPQLNPSLKSSPRKRLPTQSSCGNHNNNEAGEFYLFHENPSLQFKCIAAAGDHLLVDLSYAQMNNFIRSRSWSKAGALPQWVHTQAHIRLIWAFFPNIPAFLPNGRYTCLIFTS